ncbi:MAG: VWA domain-containing protein [Haloarculaceae archaeon]
MAFETTVEGMTVGVALPLVLAALPVALALVAWLTFRLRGPGGGWSRRRRLVLFASRALVVGCLVVAAAGPYTVVSQTTPGDPRVRMLVDESASMEVTGADPEGLAAAIEAEGVPVTSSVVASGNTSRIGDAVVANVDRGASVLLVSDGQVTGGRSLEEAGEVARDANATVHAVDLAVRAPERYVTLAGPAKTSVGVENAFLVRVDGAALENESRTVTVYADGTPVATGQVRGAGAYEFTYAFSDVGSHELEVRIDGDDRFGANDVYRKAVRVVPKPRVLYVARGEYPFGDLLDGLYDLDRAESVPSDLSPYRTVVIQDVPAPQLGNVSALQRAVIDGTGLVVAGGSNAYDNGGYANSSLAATLPVSFGEGSGRTARIALLVDVSSSAESGMRVQKAIALDALEQLGDENEVGIVAFNNRVFRVQDVVDLGENREQLREKIRRLSSRGGTDLGVGLRGAAELLGGPGTVIVISDGNDRGSTAGPVARRLGAQGVQVVTVGVGSPVNDELLTEVAGTTGGQYLRADETDRLRLLFGGESRTFASDRLTIVDRNHFITAGVETTANPPLVHDVSVRPGADFLVAAGDGTPAVTQWRYGLGRVVSITAYGNDGTLDGLLREPDSLLLSKSVNWAIGDPEGGAEGVVSAPDTRVGEPTRIRYVGDERPTGPPTFRQVDPRTYEATVTPSEPGFETVLDATYAVNYPEEYASLGPSSSVSALVRGTDGRTFRSGQAVEIARVVTQRAVSTRDVRQEWGWLLLTVALLAFLLEVVARRLGAYRRSTGRRVAAGSAPEVDSEDG